MSKLSILRLRLNQPSAHYRVPFTFSRRHTYPIPPFSTVIGMLCNVLGIRGQEEEDFKKLKGLYMAIYGRYKSLTREYIWFRNLKKEEHTTRFGSATNRFIDGVPEHPGGQAPVRVDVLEDVELIIYLGHEEESFLHQIKNAFQEPRQWLYPLHLGRAEDLVIIKDIKLIKKPKKGNAGYLPFFVWIPEDKEALWECPAGYEGFFKSIFATYHRVTTFYETVDGTRNFEFIRAKLFEKGGFPLRENANFYEFPVDEVEGREIPLILVKVGGNNGNMG